MKKTIALLIVAILTVSIVAIGLAGGDPNTCPHRNCGWKTRTAAKCTTGGTDWYYCKDCGKNLYYKNTPALGHRMQGRTCTTGEKCSRCGAAGQGPLGHNMKGRSCTTGEKCTRCGTPGRGAMGHSWKQTGKVDATYYMTGTKYSSCQRDGCNETKTETIPKLQITDAAKKNAHNLFGWNKKYNDVDASNESYIANIQKYLKKWGYNITKVDGKFGSQTQKAVFAFQKDHGISQTGIVGEQTALELTCK